MNHDLGIRAAVRAAVESQSDYWVSGLAGWQDGVLRGTPYGAVLFARERDADGRDGSDMRWYLQAPRSRTRLFLRDL